MTNRLIALPVTGESFLLRRGRQYILVDGGYNAKTLAKRLVALAPQVNRIDIVICTHADGDHAKGLAELLTYWPHSGSLGAAHNPKPIGQFWLPGSWADVVPDLMLSPRDFVDGLIHELDALARERPDLNSVESDLDDVSEALDRLVIEERSPGSLDRPGDQRRAPEEADLWNDDFDGDEVDVDIPEGLAEPEWFSDLRKRRDDVEVMAVPAQRAFASGRGRIRYRLRRDKIGRAVATYWLGLIVAMESIRKIAEQAIVHNVPVRWFDYDQFSQTRRAIGGARNLLIPLNAVEQAPPPRVGSSDHRPGPQAASGGRPHQ